MARRFVILSFIAFLATGASAPGASAASQAQKTIFYSGKGTAGADSGRDAGAYVMIESRGAHVFDRAETWKGTSSCNSNRAVPRRSDGPFTRLVGYSLGRLGPAYYLQQFEQKKTESAVRSIVILDPGVGGEFDCDKKSGAGYTYATWLRQNTNNKLLIITAETSAKDDYQGLQDVYASKLTAATVGSDVADRVLICDAPKVKHGDVDEKFSSLVGGATRTSCPSGTTLNKYSPKTSASGGSSDARRVITIDNRVTDGAGMREDATPVSLGSQPWASCSRRGCAISDTDRRSGDTYDAAVCQTTGDRVTNGQDANPADDANPSRFESTRHYGVRLPDGTFGYVSETWVRPEDRGGLGLPVC
jgi:hypothetical protein